IFLVPALQKAFTWLTGANRDGAGIVAAGLVLSVMIVPYITAISFDVCRAVPESQRAASLALGATRWQTIWRVVLPYARPGILGACFLALGRALGETMAVTMLIGNQPVIDLSPFAQGDTIASVIANQLNEADSDLQRSALVELGLVLLLVTIFINCVARLLIWRVGQTASPSRWSRHAQPSGLTEPAAAASDGQAQAPPADARFRGENPVARWTNRVMTGVLGASLVATVVPLFLILGYITYSGVRALNWEFFVQMPKPGREPGGGMAHALFGSGMLVSLATLFAVPVGLLAAIF